MCMWSASSAGLPARKAVGSPSHASTVDVLGSLMQVMLAWSFLLTGYRLLHCWLMCMLVAHAQLPLLGYVADA